jgi:hypothetical protein
MYFGIIPPDRIRAVERTDGTPITFKLDLLDLCHRSGRQHYRKHVCRDGKAREGCGSEWSCSEMPADLGIDAHSEPSNGESENDQNAAHLAPMGRDARA